MSQRKPRIAISPEALRILKALAALEGMEPDEYLSSLVMREKPRILEALGGKGYERLVVPKDPDKPQDKPHEHKTKEPIHKPKQRRPFTTQDDAIIKERYEAGATTREIAKELDRRDSAIDSRIEGLIKKGELQARK